MRGDLPIRCDCGALKGRLVDVHPGAANHMACHCTGCRAYAAQFDRDDLTDRHGSLLMFQVSPAALIVHTGREQLACLRMTEGGALRWHSGCCHTPIASGLDRRAAPVLSMHLACVDRDALPAPLEDYIGPLRGRVNGDFAPADARALRATPRAVLPMVLRIAWLCTTWVVRGHGGRSPLFDPETGEPIATPMVVGLDEEAA